MIVKNPPPGGVMIVKTGGGMILKNQAPHWGHVSEKSQMVSSSQPVVLVAGHFQRILCKGGRIRRGNAATVFFLGAPARRAGVCSNQGGIA
jgi:hypothetical protein